MVAPRLPKLRSIFQEKPGNRMNSSLLWFNEWVTLTGDRRWMLDSKIAPRISRP